MKQLLCAIHFPQLATSATTHRSRPHTARWWLSVFFCCIVGVVEIAKPNGSRFSLDSTQIDYSYIDLFIMCLRVLSTFFCGLFLRTNCELWPGNVQELKIAKIFVNTLSIQIIFEIPSIFDRETLEIQ
jgi:hypothetical protein